MVLMQLPLPDILLAQRVDRTWRALIQGSPKLQRALFFKPASDKSLVPMDMANVVLGCVKRKECDRNLHGALRPPGANIRRWVFEELDMKSHRQPVLNAFMAQACPYLNGREARKRIPEGESAKPPRVLMDRPEASWRRMLVAHPTRREVIVDHGHARHWHRIRPEEGRVGVTLEDMHESAMRFSGSISSIAGVDKMLMLEPFEIWKRVESTAEKVLAPCGFC